MNNVRMMRYHTRTRTMGSMEVYDAKQEKWVPYVPDYNAWYQHFKDLRDGYVHPDIWDVMSWAVGRNTES